ncbi:MAG: helix-turn-helix transcriptional regulator [Actinobacteria bacterium]|nr:helix-turn-helix transcriptional regulator [Actinomycetota bacterium]
MSDTAAEGAGTSPFGRRLRYWRSARGMSQLDLASAAGTTSRHLSFCETGRSRPGRDLVLRLADVLAVPVRDRNDLLEAAGLPPEYPARPLDSPQLAPVRRVLDQVLAAHDPYPAWVLGRGLAVVDANRAARVLFPGVVGLTSEQFVDVWFGPGPLADRLVNRAEVLRAGLAQLRREAWASGDPAMLAVLSRAGTLAAQAFAGSGAGATEAWHPDDSPVSCPVLDIGGRIVRTVSTVMQFDTAVEVTTSELRVELMYPADPDSDRALREVVALATAGAGAATGGSHPG